MTDKVDSDPTMDSISTESLFLKNEGEEALRNIDCVVVDSTGKVNNVHAQLETPATGESNFVELTEEQLEAGKHSNEAKVDETDVAVGQGKAFLPKRPRVSHDINRLANSDMTPRKSPQLSSGVAPVKRKQLSPDINPSASSVVAPRKSPEENAILPKRLQFNEIDPLVFSESELMSAMKEDARDMQNLDRDLEELMASCPDLFTTDILSLDSKEESEIENELDKLFEAEGSFVEWDEVASSNQAMSSSPLQQLSQLLNEGVTTSTDLQQGHSNETFCSQLIPEPEITAPTPQLVAVSNLQQERTSELPPPPATPRFVALADFLPASSSQEGYSHFTLQHDVARGNRERQNSMFIDVSAWSLVLKGTYYNPSGPAEFVYDPAFVTGSRRDHHHLNFGKQRVAPFVPNIIHRSCRRRQQESKDDDTLSK